MTNTRHPYMPLDQALAVAREAAVNWERSPHHAVANAEGWNIFDLDCHRSPIPITDLLAGAITRYDCPGDWAGCTNPIRFDCDDDVERHCRKRAMQGSATHAEALRIQHALNSLRAHAWGPEWVDSRMGPDGMTDEERKALIASGF